MNCNICNKVFKNKTGLISHYKSKAHLLKENNLNDTNSKVCTKCKGRFLHSGYNKHFENCIGKNREIFTCPHCNFSTKLNFYYLRHLKECKNKKQNSDVEECHSEGEPDHVEREKYNWDDFNHIDEFQLKN